MLHACQLIGGLVYVHLPNSTYLDTGVVMSHLIPCQESLMGVCKSVELVILAGMMVCFQAPRVPLPELYYLYMCFGISHAGVCGGCVLPCHFATVDFMTSDTCIIES